MSNEFYDYDIAISEDKLVIVFYVYDSDFDGEDYVYTYKFKGHEKDKVISLFGADTEERLKISIESRFDDGYLLEGFLNKNNIHFEKSSFEDYPGGIRETHQI